MTYNGKYSSYTQRQVMDQQQQYSILIVEEIETKRQLQALVLYGELSENERIEAYNSSLKHFYLVPFLDFGTIWQTNTNNTFFIMPCCQTLRSLRRNPQIIPHRILSIITQLYLIAIELREKTSFIINLDSIFIESQNNQFLIVKVIYYFNTMNNNSKPPNFVGAQLGTINADISAIGQLWYYLLQNTQIDCSSPDNITRTINALEIDQQYKQYMKQLILQQITPNSINYYLQCFNSIQPVISEQFMNQYDLYQRANQLFDQFNIVNEERISQALIWHHPNIQFIKDYQKNLKTLRENIRQSLIAKITKKYEPEFQQIVTQQLLLDQKFQEYQTHQLELLHLRNNLQLLSQIISPGEQFFQQETILDYQKQLEDYANNLIGLNEFEIIKRKIFKLPTKIFTNRYQQQKLRFINSLKAIYENFKEDIETFELDIRQNEFYFEEELPNMDLKKNEFLQNLQTQYDDIITQIQNLNPQITLADSYQIVEQALIVTITSQVTSLKESLDSRQIQFQNQITLQTNQLKSQIKFIALPSMPQVFARNISILSQKLTDQLLIKKIAKTIDKKQQDYEQKVKENLYAALMIQDQ